MCVYPTRDSPIATFKRNSDLIKRRVYLDISSFHRRFTPVAGPPGSRGHLPAPVATSQPGGGIPNECLEGIEQIPHPFPSATPILPPYLVTSLPASRPVPKQRVRICRFYGTNSKVKTSQGASFLPARHLPIASVSSFFSPLSLDFSCFWFLPICWFFFLCFSEEATRVITWISAETKEWRCCRFVLWFFGMCITAAIFRSIHRFCRTVCFNKKE